MLLVILVWLHCVGGFQLEVLTIGMHNCCGSFCIRKMVQELCWLPGGCLDWWAFAKYMTCIHLTNGPILFFVYV